MTSDFNNFISSIITPSAEFSPIPFWFFNDVPDKNKIQAQITDFASKGVNGFVLHPRMGIPKELEYLSDAYMDIVEFIVETASKLDMSVVLYDEGMYPSGSAHGEVVKADSSFESIGIKITADKSCGNLIAELDDGRFIVSCNTRGTIRGIHFSEDDGESNAPLSANILNPLAVDKFIELTHERYYSRLEKYFGNTVIGFFTDEPCVMGRNVKGFHEWTDGLELDIEENGGDLKELSALFDGGENKTVKLYRSLIKQRLSNVFYKKLSDWCEAHNIAFMGHPELSNDTDEAIYFHIPGQDLIFRRVAPETDGISGMDSVQAKCSADIARHLGRRRNANECFGVCSRDEIPWYMTAQDMKWFIDWLGVRGVNMFIPHAFYYSIDGARKDERPPDVGPNNIWWKYYKLFSDYMKRISTIMTDSKNCAKTAVLCKNNEVPFDEVKQLYTTQTEFNYLPVSMLDAAEIRNNKLCINGYEYDSVLNIFDDVDLKIGAHIKNNDFVTHTPCPNLRVSHIIKNNMDMYFVFNEGADPIDTEVSVPISGSPVFMDLWSGEYYKEDSKNLTLKLAGYETKLILFTNEYVPEKSRRTDLGDITDSFKLIHEVKNKKIYRTFINAETVTGNEEFSVCGGEMIECRCNGEFVGVGFFGKHKFRIGKYMQQGKNEIELCVTGNAANLYTDYNIPYGLEQQ